MQNYYIPTQISTKLDFVFLTIISTSTNGHWFLKSTFRHDTTTNYVYDAFCSFPSTQYVIYERMIFFRESKKRKETALLEIFQAEVMPYYTHSKKKSDYHFEVRNHFLFGNWKTFFDILSNPMLFT